MSLAANVCTITLPVLGANGLSSPARTLAFSIARSDRGMVIDRTMVELEELTTPGVDGRRWRQVRTYFPSFTLETWADFTDYPTAVNECRNYYAAQAQFVTLNWTASTFNAQWLLVKVVDVQAKVSAGVMCGFGAATSSGALIHAVWTLNVQAVDGANPT